jgi:hypothetical protein
MEQVVKHQAQGLRLAPGLPALTSEGLSTAMALGKVLAESGYFADVKNAAQAVVKIIKGQALGWDPIYSLSNVYVIQAKGRDGTVYPPTVALSAQGLASLIKASGRYDYELAQCDEKVCVIEFYSVRAGKRHLIHIERYSMEDAKRAGLDVRANYGKFPRAMLRSGCMRHGFTVACPELATGCSPNGDTGAEAVDADATQEFCDTLSDSEREQKINDLWGEDPNTKPARVVNQGTGEVGDPQEIEPDADDARETGVEPEQAAPAPVLQDAKGRVLAEIRIIRQTKPKSADTDMTEPQRGALFAALAASKVATDADRHAMLLYLLGHQSTTTMTQAEAISVIHWLQEPTRNGDVAAVVRAGHLALGQSEMQVEAA